MSEEVLNAAREAAGVARCIGYNEGLLDGIRLADRYGPRPLAKHILDLGDAYEEKHAPKEIEHDGSRTCTGCCGRCDGSCDSESGE